MKDDPLVLITGGAKRIGRALALAAAGKGFAVAVHYNQSREEAESLAGEIEALGRRVVLLQGDLSLREEIESLGRELGELPGLAALVNNASIFHRISWRETDFENWNRHLAINLTAPFFLSQAFARALPPGRRGRIVNLLDWRIDRPEPLHLPYSVSKAALASVTRNLALALAPEIAVNAIALGAVLPPTDGSGGGNVGEEVPARRWASLEEVEEVFLFLLTGPDYLTGEILRLDGGKNLV